MKDKMPKKGGRWWFSWRSRNNDYQSVSAQIDMQMVNLFIYDSPYHLLDFRKNGERISQISSLGHTCDLWLFCSSGISDRSSWRPRWDFHNNGPSKQVTLDFKTVYFSLHTYWHIFSYLFNLIWAFLSCIIQAEGWIILKWWRPQIIQSAIRSLSVRAPWEFWWNLLQEDSSAHVRAAGTVFVSTLAFIDINRNTNDLI